MTQKGRRNADHKLLMAFACGATVENAARQAGVSKSTAQRRLDDPAFCRQLQAMRADMIQRTATALTAASTESVRTLLELQKPSTPPPVRLGAARAVLEIGIKLRVAPLDYALHGSNHADALHDEDALKASPMCTGEVVQMLSARLRQLDAAELPAGEKSRLTATLADALLRAIGVDVVDKRLEALQAVLLGRKDKGQ